MKFKNSLKQRILIKPFIYKRESLSVQSLKIIFLLMIQVLMLLFTKTYNSFILVLVSVAASLLSELFVSKCFLQKEHASALISVIQGILIAMMIPGTFNPVTVFFCVFLSMIVSKYIFGGFAYTWINPVAFSVIVLWFSAKSLFPEFLVTKDILMLRNPCLQLIENGTFPVSSFDTGLTDFFNTHLFSLFKVSIPEGYISLFWDSHSVIPAFRFNFITIVSSIFIFSSDSNKAIVPFSFMLVYLVLVRILSPVFTECVPFQGDMILSLLSSGTLFTAVFLFNSYGTQPVTKIGKAIYGFVAGLVAFFVCGCGTSSSGMIFTVLIADLFSLLIQWGEDYFTRKSVLKVIKLQESIK